MEGFAAAVVLLAILAGILLVVSFDLFCLVHLVTRDRVRFLPKLVWAVAIVCISPLGGLVYLRFGRHSALSNLIGANGFAVGGGDLGGRGLYALEDAIGGSALDGALSRRKNRRHCWTDYLY